MTPDEYCQQKAAASGSSFYYSFLFLPPERRRAITALYAFCREVDDVVDECTDTGVAAAKLAWWRNEVAALFAGTPQHPVTKALAPAVERFGVTQARLNARFTVAGSMPGQTFCISAQMTSSPAMRIVGTPACAAIVAKISPSLTDRPCRRTSL